MINIKYLIWALLAGSFIPVVGILNGRVGRALGEPLHASVLLFGVAILLALTVAALAGRGLPNIGDFRQFPRCRKRRCRSSSSACPGPLVP